jgi:AraC-like DNA-binding protein
VASHSESIALPLPGIRALRWTSDALYCGIKEVYAISRTELGRSECWSAGRRWHNEPGGLAFKQPGEVHRDLRRDGIGRSLIVAFDTHLVDSACQSARPQRLRRCQLDAADPRGAAFHRLCAAIDRGADRLALEVAASEALAALAHELTGEAPAAPRPPVQRAIELLRARLAEQVSLDAIAAHAGLDKFHLSRAFRDHVGLPPHAYLTQLRVQRAKQLLAAGMRPSEVAPRVGFYDQSQLHRHFRRIVGTTPGRYRSAPHRK